MGVPRSISNSDLEEKVLKIFEKVGCPIMGNNIEACHWISKKMKGGIFSLKGLPKCTWREELRKVDMKEIGLLEDNPIFLNQSLCTYYPVLRSKANVSIPWNKSVAFMC